VVIVIVGILSAFIIVSMAGVSSKATIAKGQALANSIKNALMADLISEWRLDGNADDFWGTNTGTLIGPTHLPVAKSGSDCISGGCYEFDGTEDYINCGTGSSLDVANAVTVETWIKTIAFGTNQYRGMVGRKTGAQVDGCGYQYGLSSTWTNGNYLQFWAHKEGFSDCNSSAVVSSSNPISLDKWYYVVGTYDYTTGKQNIYLNGVLNNSSDKGAGLKIRSFSNQVLTIGRSPGGGPWYFNGLIDNVRVYNQAIPSSRIKEQYYSGLNNLLVRGGFDAAEYGQKLGELKTNLSNNE